MASWKTENIFEAALLRLWNDMASVWIGRGTDRGNTVFKVLCYKSEGRWFDPSWCHWNFSLT